MEDIEDSEKRKEAVSAAARNDTDDRDALGSPKKISSLYVIAFLILATLVAGFIWHDLRADYLNTLAYWNVQLSSSADDRVKVGTLWLKERQTDTMAIAENPSTIRLLSAGEDKRKVAGIRQQVEVAIAHIAAVNGFLGGAVGDRDCQIVAQTGLQPEMAQGIQEACQRVQQTGEYQMNTFGMEQGHVWLNLSAPVMAKVPASSPAQITRRRVGSVVMVTENWQDFILISGAENIPTHSSATLIVWKKAGEALIFSPRLSARGVPSFFRRPTAGPTLESRVAREGDVAFGEFTDYRGVRVLGAARRIAAGIDSVASKVDWDEALSDYHRHRVLDWLAGILSLLLLGTVMVAVHRHTAARGLEERFRQQEALLELKQHIEVSEERFRDLVETAEAIVWEAEASTRGITFVNQGAEKILGYPTDQWLRTPGFWTDHICPEDRQKALACEREVTEKGKPRSAEYRMKTADGRVLWFRDFMYAVLGPEGKVERLRGIMVDITESKRAEEALRQSEAELKEALLAAQMGVWEWTLATGTSTWDENLYRIAGRDPQLPAPSPQEYPEIFTPESWERLKAAAENALSTGTSCELDLELVRPDGSKRWLIGRGEPLRDASGHITQLRGTVQDITERKRAEEQIRKLSRAVEQSPACVVITDARGDIEYVNPKFTQLTGYTAEEVAGRNPRILKSGLVPAATYEELWKTLISGGEWHGEFANRKKNGEIYWESASIVPIRDSGGAITHFLAVKEDITERKRAEEERQGSFDQLREFAARLQSIREEERKRVAREIHDQLGQALTAIKIDLSSLVRELPAGEGQPAKRTASILQLVDESIQSVRRISTELRPGILDDLGLVAAIEWAGEDFEARTGTRCRLDLPPEGMAVDPERATAIFRIFQETLTNVARHADASQVDVRMAREDGMLTLEVYDNGKGITEKQLSNRESLGILGMRERAMLLGGELTISSRPGNGTTVKVRIPVAGQTEEEEFQ